MDAPSTEICIEGRPDGLSGPQFRRKFQPTVLRPGTHDVEVEASALVARFEDFPSNDSQTWGMMNRRRAELIRKKVYQGDNSLSSDERREFEWLQEMSRNALREAYPSPTGDRALIESMKARLREGLESR